MKIQAFVWEKHWLDLNVALLLLSRVHTVLSLVQKEATTLNCCFFYSFLCMSMKILQRTKKSNVLQHFNWSSLVHSSQQHYFTFSSTLKHFKPTLPFYSLFQRSFLPTEKKWPTQSSLALHGKNDWKFGLPDFPRDSTALGCRRWAWKNQEQCFQNPSCASGCSRVADS